jgi:hypothetical protein
MSALMTEEYLTERASRASRGKVVAALSKVADAEPDPADLVAERKISKRRRKAG